MDEKPGVATRLIYQLFIALGQKSVSKSIFAILFDSFEKFLKFSDGLKGGLLVFKF